MKSERRADNRHNRREGNSGSQSAARTLAVLDVLGDSPEALGVREIARRLDLASSIVQRLVTTLVDYNYIERAPDGQKYQVGYRSFQIGRSYVTKSDLYTASLPELRRMADDQINAYLGVRREGVIVYLAALQSKGPIGITGTPGATARLHSTAFGKVLLADMSNSEIASILGGQPFHRMTPKTKVKLVPLLHEIEKVRRLGYAVSDGENIEDVFAVGAAIRDGSGRAVAAISGALPRNQLRKSDIDNLSCIVTDAAQRISQRLGASSSMFPGSARDHSSDAGKPKAVCR